MKRDMPEKVTDKVGNISVFRRFHTVLKDPVRRRWTATRVEQTKVIPCAFLYAYLRRNRFDRNHIARLISGTNTPQKAFIYQQVCMKKFDAFDAEILA